MTPSSNFNDPLCVQVGEFFGPDSSLSNALDNFRPRSGQAKMALAIAQALKKGGGLVVEAGTGTGKTFAYLIPVLLSGQRALISTASKTLQDQLFARDLPQLIETLGLPVRIALLKGRGNYLCLHRLKMARHESSAGQPINSRALGRIELWSKSTRTGDLAEMPGLDERSPLLPLITSTRENCLGNQCDHHRACHVNLARREAMAADVVVINHHLFFADLAVRESGMAELLPTVDTVIFDEAHQINEVGIQFLGNVFSSSQCLDFCRDLLACGLQQARGLVDWVDCVGQLERCLRDLRLVLSRTSGKGNGIRLRWVGDTPETTDSAKWLQGLESLASAFVTITDAISAVTELSSDFVRLHERSISLGQRVKDFMAPPSDESVRWLDINGSHLRLVESPLDIAKIMQSRLLKVDEAGAGTTWIFTSATLGDDPELRWFTEPCGLAQADVLRVDSPFDYRHQAALYVPSDLPEPSSQQHATALAHRIAQWSSVIGGRTLVLTTSLRALHVIGEVLQQHFLQTGMLQVLVQGQLPKRELMARFRDPNASTGSILVATASFWEGFDVPGDALQLVVIDKLPFPPPNDPLVEARSNRLRQGGRSPFNDYFLPEAAVALKQGAGRLIRKEDDRGILVVADVRLLSKSYGKRLFGALPAMRRIESEKEMQLALTGLTTASTTI